jgi:hypothetical protein
MKFVYLASASTVFAITNVAALKFPRQLVAGTTQLQCNGTSAAECSQTWWTLCSQSGHIVMPAPVTWKNGDCTDLNCQCTEPHLPMETAAVVPLDGNPTVTHTRPHGTPHPHKKTIDPGPNATPLAGSYIWKRGDEERENGHLQPPMEAAVVHTHSHHSATATPTRRHGTPHPHTKTLDPGPDATPLAGSYIWK